MKELVDLISYDHIHACIQQFRFKLAVALLNELIQHYPSNPVWYELCLFISSQNPRMEEFRYWYRIILSEFPNSSQAWIAKALYPGVSVHEAKKSLIQAVKMEPENPYIHYLLGKTYRNLGKYQQAILCFDRCLESDNGFHLAYQARMSCYEQIGDLFNQTKDALSLICYSNNVNKQYLFNKILDEFDSRLNSNKKLPPQKKE